MWRTVDCSTPCSGWKPGEDLERHPKVGASWEGFALGEVITRLGARPEQCFFWATHTGAELDLLVVRGTRRWGFEFKRTVAPRLTRSMHSALADLHLERLEVVHAGEQTFPLAGRGARAGPAAAARRSGPLAGVV